MEIFGIIITIVFLYIGGICASLYKNNKKNEAIQNGKHYYIDKDGKCYSTKNNRQVILGVKWHNGRHVQTLYDVNYHKITEAYDTETGEQVNM